MKPSMRLEPLNRVLLPFISFSKFDGAMKENV